MNALKRKPPVVLVLLFMCSLALLSACSQPAPAMSLVDIQAEIDNAVAATLQAYGVDTQEGSVKTVSLVSADEAQPPAEAANPTATLPPPPTATLIPTATLPPTEAPTAPPPTNPPPTAAVAAPAAAQPTISAEVNTNCRQGPSRAYRVDSYLLEGDTSTVYGRNSANTWWYIENPTKEGKYCWVWGETTTVQGDTSAIPVVEAPPEPSYSSHSSDEYICYAYGASYACRPKYYSCWNPKNCYWRPCGYWRWEYKYPVYCQKPTYYPSHCYQSHKNWCKCYPWLCDDDD